MKNTFGTSVCLTLFGESHGMCVGAVLDGLAPGIPVDPAFIQMQMRRRQAVGELTTARHEPDEVQIVSGVYRGCTTGTPLCLLIANTDCRETDYAALEQRPRPGHGDYTAFCKYRGFQDPRGGGHGSGRLTAPLVAAGAIALAALQGKGITVSTHIARLAGIDDRPFDPLTAPPTLSVPFPVLDPAAGERMQAAIAAAKEDGDSVGGVLETAVAGLPAGVGEPWFDTVESLLSHGLFAIPGVCGVSFGEGFALADRRGSDADDPLCCDGDRIVTATNRVGGINGGITNGMPVLFRCAVKPTPSVSRPLQTVDLKTRRPVTQHLTGRHDPAIVPRAAAVVDAVTALVLCDLLAGRYGTDYLAPDTGGNR